MSLCHTWTGVSELDEGDYSAASSDMQQAVDDDPSNAVAQRLVPRIEQEYRLITAVDDINQRFEAVGNSPTVEFALENIGNNNVSDSAREAKLAGGTLRQQRAAFRFLRYFEDAYLVNYSLNAHIDSDEGDPASPTDFAPSSNREYYDQYQMVLAYPQITDLGRLAFANDKLEEVSGFDTILAIRRGSDDPQQDLSDMLADLPLGPDIYSDNDDLGLDQTAPLYQYNPDGSVKLQ